MRARGELERTIMTERYATRSTWTTVVSLSAALLSCGNASHGGGGGIRSGGASSSSPESTADGGRTGVGGAGGQPGCAAGAESTYANPVIPGFHPDPSIVRVGEDYYLVTSSFEYFPGVPIFHSRDLVNWEQIGHCLTRPSQVALSSAKSSGGIYAPTLRYHDGVFYMITTNVSGGGNFYVTATEPGGDWSEPITIKGDAAGGIDPSLFFDDDGKVYFTREGDGEKGGIFQSEIDITTGKLAAKPIEIWSGTGGIWPEGPHLYKIGEYYYLMIAEGGTSYGHMETLARASAPMGPFEAYSRNPILTQSNSPDSPIQATGHGDLVQLPDGGWWMVLLGIRPSDGTGHHHHLGRETFLAPVTWDSSNWPTVNHGEPISLLMSATGLPCRQPSPTEPIRDDFTDSKLGMVWNFLRRPTDTLWSLSSRPGALRLNGTKVSLDMVGTPAFVGRRQAHFRAHGSVSIEFSPTEDAQEAGLTLRANEDNHYDLVIVQVANERRVQMRTRIAGVTKITSDVTLPAGPALLTVEAYRDRYEFFVTGADGGNSSLGAASTEALSSETAGGFTGVYWGMFAYSGSDTSTMPPADFDWFDYQGWND